jgi:hypothetical protein
VTGVLLTPVLHEHLLGTRHNVAAGGQPGQPGTHDTPIPGRARWVRTRIGVDARSAPPRCRVRRAQLVVVRVEHVHVGVGREVRSERHPQEPSIPEVVDVDVEVGEDRWRGVGERVEYLDDATLLGHEDAAVAGEPHHGWIGQTAERHQLLETGGECRCGRRRRITNHRRRNPRREEREGHRG